MTRTRFVHYSSSELASLPAPECISFLGACLKDGTTDIMLYLNGSNILSTKIHDYSTYTTETSLSGIVASKGYAFYDSGILWVDSSGNVNRTEYSGGSWSTTTIYSGTDPYVIGERLYMDGSDMYIIGVSGGPYTLSTGDTPIGGYWDGVSYYWAVLNGNTVYFKKNYGDDTRDSETYSSSLSATSETKFVSHRFQAGPVLIGTTNWLYILDKVYNSNNIVYDPFEGVLVVGNGVWVYDRLNLVYMGDDFVYNWSATSVEVAPKSNDGTLWYTFGKKLNPDYEIQSFTVKYFEGTAKIVFPHDVFDDFKNIQYIKVWDEDGNRIWEGYCDKLYKDENDYTYLECSSRWTKERKNTDGTLRYLLDSDVEPIDGVEYDQVVSEYCKRTGQFARYDYDTNTLIVDSASTLLATVDVDGGDLADKPIKKTISNPISKVILYGTNGLKYEKNYPVSGDIVVDYYPGIGILSHLEDLADQIHEKGSLMTIKLTVYNKPPIKYGGQVQYRDSNYGFTTLETYYCVECEYEIESQAQTIYLRDALWYDNPTKSSLGKPSIEKNSGTYIRDSHNSTLTQDELQNLLDNNLVVDLKGRIVEITSTLTMPKHSVLKNGMIRINMTGGTGIYMKYGAIIENVYFYDTTNATASLYAINMAEPYCVVSNCQFYNKQYGTNLLRWILMGSAYQAVTGCIFADYAGDYVYQSITIGSSCIRSSVTGCVITNGYFAIGVYGDYVNISGCSIYSTKSYGIYVDGASDHCNITANTINAGSYAIYLYNSTNTTIVGNCCSTSIGYTSSSTHKIAHNYGSTTHET